MLSSSINQDNCLRMYFLADVMQSLHFKRKAFEVIESNWEALVRMVYNESLKDFIMNHPILALRLTRDIFVDKSKYSYKPFWKATVMMVHKNPLMWTNIIFDDPDTAIEFIGYSVQEGPNN